MPSWGAGVKRLRTRWNNYIEELRMQHAIGAFRQSMAGLGAPVDGMSDEMIIRSAALLSEASKQMSCTSEQFVTAFREALEARP